MKGKLILSALVMVSFINSLLADPEAARAQAVDNVNILYKSASPIEPSSWDFYFGPSEELAASNSVANKERSVMQSYFLGQKFPSKQVQRSVSWLFDASMQLQMYEYGVIPSDAASDTSSEAASSLDNYGY